MYNELYHSYLKHHGVKGMKWGRRRYQNKDGSLTSAGKKRTKKLRVSKEARQMGRQFEEAEYKKLRKEYGIEEKSAEAYAYGRKHKLDLDDGGGGSRKAGEKYMSMWDEIDALDERARSTAKERSKQFVQEIAEIEELDRLEKRGYL